MRKMCEAWLSITTSDWVAGCVHSVLNDRFQLKCWVLHKFSYAFHSMAAWTWAVWNRLETKSNKGQKWIDKGLNEKAL